MEIGQPEAYTLEADDDTLNMNGTEGNWRIFRDKEYIGGGINKEIAFAEAQKLHDTWLELK